MNNVDLVFDLSPLVVGGGAHALVTVPAREVTSYNGITLVAHDVYTLVTAQQGVTKTLDAGVSIDNIKEYWRIVPSKMNWRALSIAEIGHCIGVQRSDKRKDISDMEALVDLILKDGNIMQELLAKRAGAYVWGDL